MRADLAGNAAQPSRISDQAVRMPDLTCLHVEELLARASLKQALMQPEDMHNRHRNRRQARGFGSEDAECSGTVFPAQLRRRSGRPWNRSDATGCSKRQPCPRGLAAA